MLSKRLLERVAIQSVRRLLLDGYHKSGVNSLNILPIYHICRYPYSTGDSQTANQQSGKFSAQDDDGTAAADDPINSPKTSHVGSRVKYRRAFSAGGEDQATGNKELIALEELKFEQVPPDRRNKNTFVAAIHLFTNTRGKGSRGHVEFIYAAMKHLKAFGLHKDLDVYKSLLNVFPKGPLIPTNTIQRKFMHYPQEQACCVTLLDWMEYHGCQPDKEVHDIVLNVFGDWNFATRKAKRMLYWMPKLKHTNHYLDRREVEYKQLNPTELARIALKMMCRDSGTQFTYLKTATTEIESKAHWIVSAQSPLQQHIIARMLPPSRTIYYVDGPYAVWVMDKRVEYCVLSTDPMCTADEEFVDQRANYDYNPSDFLSYADKEAAKQSMHQQADQTILALAVMEEQRQAVATAWVNHLQSRNPAMAGANVLFRIREIKPTELATGVEESEDNG